MQVRGDKSGEVTAHLYVDGLHHAESKVPARLPVPDGVIEVDVATFGLRRCHFVPDTGAERPLTPHPQSTEGRRAGFERKHPAPSRWVGIVSVLLGSTERALRLQYSWLDSLELGPR